MNRLLVLLLAIAIVPISHAQQIATEAAHFVDLLSSEQQAQAVRSAEDELRYKWYYVPLLREGPSLKDLDSEQEGIAFGLLNQSLSPSGLAKAKDIIWLENVLKVKEGGPGTMPDGTPRRDPEKYHLLFFGKPSEETPWSYRFEGHHLSLSFTFIGNKMVSGTPAFFGTNPGKVDVEGFDKKEVLRRETALGFELVNALTKKQKSTAIFSDIAPDEILTANHRVASAPEYQGLPYNSLNDRQKEVFDELLMCYINNYQFGFSDLLLEKIKKAGYDKLSFAWAGSLQPGAGHYYRIQGPTLLIEYDNTQNGANHVHTVIRDLTNDYGEDILREHYATDH